MAFAAVLPIAMSAQHARGETAPLASAPSCFEVIPALAGAQPAILIDRCSGRTWQLVPRYVTGRRQAQVTYSWKPIVRMDNEVVDAGPRALPSTGHPKCFTFTGRTFCE